MNSELKEVALILADYACKCLHYETYRPPNVQQGDIKKIAEKYQELKKDKKENVDPPFYTVDEEMKLKLKNNTDQEMAFDIWLVADILKRSKNDPNFDFLIEKLVFCSLELSDRFRENRNIKKDFERLDPDLCELRDEVDKLEVFANIVLNRLNGSSSDIIDEITGGHVKGILCTLNKISHDITIKTEHKKEVKRSIVDLYPIFGILVSGEVYVRKENIIISKLKLILLSLKDAMKGK